MERSLFLYSSGGTSAEEGHLNISTIDQVA